MNGEYNSKIVEQGGETVHKCERTYKCDVIVIDDDESITSNMQKSNAVDGSSTQQENNVVQAEQETKKRSYSPQPHPSKKLHQELHSIDYLARWNSTISDEDRAASSSTSTPFDKTTIGLVPRVSMDESDDLSLELQLCSKNTNKPDLELKLGR